MVLHHAHYANKIIFRLLYLILQQKAVLQNFYEAEKLRHFCRRIKMTVDEMLSNGTEKMEKAVAALKKEFRTNPYRQS